MIDQKRGLNMEEACEYVGGISRNGMYQLLGKKLLRSYLIGNRRYFLREELDAFLERQMDGESFEDGVLGGMKIILCGLGFDIDIQFRQEVAFATGYWKCDCESHYIHPRAEGQCNVCNAFEENHPHSRLDELLNELRNRRVSAESDMDQD